jgi:HPt (histidine-containing phosphotransfer) domain-containing protein
MTVIELDRGRLEALTVFSADELSEIAEGVIQGTVEMIDAIDTALGRDDLPAVVQAAHRGRNEALLVGARELEGAFSAVEAAARRGQLEALTEAIESIGAVWPETRSAIERIRFDSQR